jgi:hypothetical protein
MTAPHPAPALTLLVPEGPRRIRTPRRDHLPFDSGDPSPDGRYSACTWDHGSGRWETYRRGVTLMGLRAVLRQLESDGWSPASYLVERE